MNWNKLFKSIGKALKLMIKPLIIGLITFTLIYLINTFDIKQFVYGFLFGNVITILIIVVFMEYREN